MCTVSRRGYRKSDKILVSSIKNFPYVKKVCLELMILSTLKLKALIMFGVGNSSVDYLYRFSIEINDMRCLLHPLC